MIMLMMKRLIKYSFEDTNWKFKDLSLVEKEIVGCQAELDKLKAIAFSDSTDPDFLEDVIAHLPLSKCTNNPGVVKFCRMIIKVADSTLGDTK